MTNNAQSDTTAALKDIVADVQTKAKDAFEKSTAAFAEAGDFAKGNVEALVESGKIFAAGLQALSAATMADTRSAFEALTADANELAAARTPVEFFKLQGEIARKQFDSAVAQGSKNSETWLKLVGDAFAPISGRVSMAVEKIKQAA